MTLKMFSSQDKVTWMRMARHRLAWTQAFCEVYLPPK